ncbi:MAG: bifunctional phosphopantothenoylcysteine decarboxylase/phosphopantothenate--cysteine ligase CoaBC [Deltaproteobacteria bacterium]|nr:bifunctional phosphopantothenoylcysteine decarboxylase/phosphopantothenate--cysteine ligase CoaBC [Deltaproteobacteria bacterium]
MNPLQGREIVLGVCGGIAAYKAVSLLRLLVQAGAGVNVVMTAGAQRFVAPLTFQTLSGRPVGTDLFSLDQESRMGHIQLADSAQAVVVAPATAHLLAKLRAGLSDDLLSTLLLATPAPVFLAPAMNDRMWVHPATTENLAVLQQRGVHIIPPEHGYLAEGREGVGRLAEPETILAGLAAWFSRGEGILNGRTVIVSAGPTEEPLDPVRSLTNRSSGKMGFALAQAAQEAGAKVLLVSGPVALPTPPGVERVNVRTAVDMEQAVLGRQAQADALILAAAVADYRPKEASLSKIKRALRPALTLELVANPDIAAQAGRAKQPGQVLAVFAAETEQLETHAAAKLAAKNADLVVANNPTLPGAGFGDDLNEGWLLRKGEEPEALPRQTKAAMARRVIEAVAALLPKP